MITANATQGGRTYAVRIDRGESFDLVATTDRGAPLWKATLSTPYHCIEQASIHVTARGEIEVRAVGFHVKDDSYREFVWRYTRDGAETSCL